MNKGLLIILSGPSGVGKGTVRKHVMRDPTLRLSYSISMTTRKPRDKESNGVEYFFVSNEEFQKNIDEGNFLEWCEFVGNRYGTPLDKVEEARNRGENVFLEIEVSGAAQVLDKVKDDGVVSIFLLPPSIKMLESRIRHRKSESEEVIQARLEKGKSELNKLSNYKYFVINDHVLNASKTIAKIIREEISSNLRKRNQKK